MRVVGRVEGSDGWVEVRGGEGEGGGAMWHRGVVPILSARERQTPGTFDGSETRGLFVLLATIKEAW